MKSIVIRYCIVLLLDCIIIVKVMVCDKAVTQPMVTLRMQMPPFWFYLDIPLKYYLNIFVRKKWNVSVGQWSLWRTNRQSNRYN